jgi:glycosyltransferase involved in cell wall biosynthesis
MLADGIAENKIITLPLGFDMDYVPYQPKQLPNFESRPLKLLYAGTLTQRKGIKYLLNVMKQLKGENITLTCIGGIQGSGKGLSAYNGLFTHIPAVSQLEMFQLYQEYDALVLPTVFEGFGLVIVEAMAAGLPVITTPHSIGPELIKNGENGYIVPIRNEKDLLEAIISLRNLTSEAYQETRLKARSTVEAYTWKAYNNRLATVCNKIEAQL